MIKDLGREAGKYGLKLHMGKTKVLTNCRHRRPSVLTCGEQQLQVLGMTEAEKYLGRKLATGSYHDTEVANRMASAWASFFKLKDVLCNRRLPLKHRIKLFDATVAPSALYACGTWTMIAERAHLLQKTRRRMLRWMVHTPRRHDESWVEYITRATHHAEDLAALHGSTSWNLTQRARTWQLAGKAAAQVDQRWTNRLLNWKPWFRCWPKRRVGRPVKRWSDDIISFAGGSWTEFASDASLWALSLQSFVDADGTAWRSRGS